MVFKGNGQIQKSHHSESNEHTHTDNFMYTRGQRAQNSSIQWVGNK